MHEHSFRRTSRVGTWRPSPEPGIEIAYEEWINRCDCGEERPIRTRPRGIWQRASRANLKNLGTYPPRWQDILKRLLRGRTATGEDGVLVSVDTVVRAAGAAWHEVEPLLQALLRDGAVERFTPMRGSRIKGPKVRFTPQAVETLRASLGIDSDDRQRGLIDEFFSGWEYPATAEGPASEVAVLLDNMQVLWKQYRKPAVPLPGNRTPLVMKSTGNYYLLLQSLREIFNLCLSGEMLSFRELAVRLTGHSKGLESVKPYLRQLLSPLSRFSIVEHSPLLFCRLPLRGSVSGRKVDLSASVDYVVLTAGSAREFVPEDGELRRLVLVENLTPFEFLCRKADLLGPHTGVVFLSGYPPGHVREFTRKIIAFREVEGLLWCDLDPQGVEIALTAAGWFGKDRWSPLWMSPELLKKTDPLPLSETDRKKAEELLSRADALALHPLLKEMLSLGVKAEQESLLDMEDVRELRGLRA